MTLQSHIVTSVAATLSVKRCVSSVERSESISSVIRWIIFALVTLALLPNRTRAQSTTQSSEPTFEVHEWSVYLIDAAQSQINPDGAITSTLPDFMDSRRGSSSPETKNGPQPISVIRITGESSTPIDVMVEKSGGEFLASWPKAESRQKQLLWRDLKPSTQPGDKKLADIDTANWLTDLRNSEAPFLTRADSASERFLLYDFQLPCPTPVKVAADGNFSYGLTNVSKSTLHNLTFYQGDQSRWREANLGDLAPAKPPTTQPATQSTTKSVAATKPATQPAQAEAKLMSVAATQPSDLAAEWKPRFLDAGISSGDAEIILRILATQAFDSRRLTAVCLVDETTCDRLFPLEVVPEPKRIIRVGIVIIRHADPAAGTEIDDLIAELGDPVWAKRDAAYKALEKLGAAAQPKLREAVSKNKDVEIVWRAERLLQSPQSSP
jgi:hypothetical protein